MVQLLLIQVEFVSRMKREEEDVLLLKSVSLSGVTNSVE